MAEEYQHTMKLLLIGDAGVGKSSILLRFTDGMFNEHQASTIGVDFKVKTIKGSGKNIKLTIWDTAGQERFRTLTSSYYRDAHGVLLVYDVTRPDTFSHLNAWLEEVSMYCPGGGKGTVKLLVGNKTDLEEREVSRADGEAWAKSKGMLFVESSAKTDSRIKEVFEEVVQAILQNPDILARTVPAAARGRTVRVSSGAEAPASGACC